MLKCFKTFPCRVFFGGAKENSTLVQHHLDATQMFQIKAIYRNTAALENTKNTETFEEKWKKKHLNAIYRKMAVLENTKKHQEK